MSCITNTSKQRHGNAHVLHTQSSGEWRNWEKVTTTTRKSSMLFEYITVMQNRRIMEPKIKKYKKFIQIFGYFKGSHYSQRSVCGRYLMWIFRIGIEYGKKLSNGHKTTVASCQSIMYFGLPNFSSRISNISPKLIRNWVQKISSSSPDYNSF